MVGHQPCQNRQGAGAGFEAEESGPDTICNVCTIVQGLHIRINNLQQVNGAEIHQCAQLDGLKKWASGNFFEVIHSDELEGPSGVNKRILRNITTLEAPGPRSGPGPRFGCRLGADGDSAGDSSSSGLPRWFRTAGRW